MQVDKRVVVSTFMKAMNSDLCVLYSNAADRDALKKAQQELEKFMRQPNDYMIVAVRKK